MGTLVVTDRVQCGKSEIRQLFERMIEHDFETRETEDDMYRGDLGSTQWITPRFTEMTGKSENAIRRNFEQFSDHFLDSTTYRKYELVYQVIGQHGYIAQTLRVIVPDPPRGTYRVKDQTFRNVTELRAFMKKCSDPKRYAGAVVTCNGHRVGRIGTESRTYKSKPKQLPKKYQWLDEQVTVAYGARNPY